MTLLDEHDEYLNSEEWKRVRMQRISHDNGRCQNCGSTVNLQVHHKNYDSDGGGENIKNDLVTLCIDCHNKVTQQSRSRRQGVINSERGIPHGEYNTFWW